LTDLPPCAWIPRAEPDTVSPTAPPIDLFNGATN
jgi:hypothetical protein